MNTPARPPQKKALLVASNYIYCNTEQCTVESSVSMAQAAADGESIVSTNGSLATSSSLPASGDQIPLVNPCKDAWKWKTLLIEHFDFPENMICTLVDEEHDCPPSSMARQPSDVAGSLGKIHQHNPRMRPKRANIKRELLELVKDPIPGDTLFFFYAGHVGQLTCDEHSETDGQDEALIPADAVRPWECLHIPAESLRQIDHGSWLKDNELKKILVNDLPHGVRLVCVVDACHSGTLFDLPHGPCNTAQIAAARRLRTYLPDIPHLSRPSSRASLLRPEIVCKNAFCPRRPAVTTATTSSIDIVTNPNFRGKENVRMIATADDRRDGVPGRRNSSHDSCHMHCSCRSFQDSESSQILGGADANTSFDSEWPMSSFRFMGRSEPDAFQCESPTVMLPLLSEVEQPCGESCKVDPDFMGPHIVTISACMDDQEAWENKKTGGSLTQILVPYLKQHRKPTYRALMEHTNNKLDNIVHNVHKRYRRNLVSGVYYPQGGPYHGPAYQDPQLCSLTPLDLDELFIL